MAVTLKDPQDGDIAEVIHWCVTRPAHLNINTIELMPTDQAFNPLAVHRRRN